MANVAEKYKPLMLENERTSRANIRPLGVYQISTYKTADDAWRRLKRSEKTLVFATGIFEGKLNCIKLSVIPPDKFFKWFGGLVRTGHRMFDTDEQRIPLYEIGERVATSGKRLYEQHIKGNLSLQIIENPYRTYNISGIQHIREIVFKREVLEAYYR